MNFFSFLIKNLKEFLNAIAWTFYEKNMLIEQEEKRRKNDSL